jgi:hypothetical protein
VISGNRVVDGEADTDLTDVTRKNALCAGEKESLDHMKRSLAYTQLCDGLPLTGSRVQYNDGRYILIVNGRFVDLTPTEYLLWKLLYERRIRPDQDGDADRFVSYEELESRTSLPRYLVQRHLQNADLKFQAATPFRIASVGDLGYLLVVRAPTPTSRRVDGGLQLSYAV